MRGTSRTEAALGTMGSTINGTGGTQWPYGQEMTAPNGLDRKQETKLQEQEKTRWSLFTLWVGKGAPA